MISAGFAGALVDDVAVGDVILATELSQNETIWLATWPSCDATANLRRGRLVTTERLVATPTDKMALAGQSGALAVDMESAVVAETCGRKGIPFGSVRAVSDNCHTSLSPNLVSLLAGGRVSLGRLAPMLAASPHMAFELWRLARHTRRAAGRLALALADLIALGAADCLHPGKAGPV
jgi:adenosylhomocysteine nucleosidase